jgi:hypothetical protein
MIVVTVTATALGADSTFDGVYIGKRVLTKGSNQTCPDAGTIRHHPWQRADVHQQ